MPLAVAALVNSITAIAAFFAAYLTKKVALGAALLTVSGVLAAALWVSLKALLSGLSYAMPSYSFVSVAAYIVNFGSAMAFMSVAAGVEIAVSVYLYSRRMAQNLATVS